MEISELLSTPGYVCDNCHHDFGRSDHLRLHQQGRCRGIPAPPCQLCDVCWQWVKGNKRHVTRHQRGSRCRNLADRIEHRNQIAAARRQRVAAYHRERRRQQRESAGTQDQVVESDGKQDQLDQLLESDDGQDPSDHVDDCGTDNPTQPDFAQDQVARDDAEDQVYDDYAHDLLDQLVMIGDDDLSDIVAMPNLLELEHQDNDNHQEIQGAQDDQVRQENEEEEHVQAPGHQESSKATGRDGVTDCVICLDPLDGETWVCDQDSCRQPYHRECIKRTIPIDPRCSNCRAYVHLEVDDDEVMIVKNVAAPPKCVVCLKIITGVVLEGPQCSHTVDYECLVTYNAQYLRNIRSRDLQCPACSQPFPVPDELTFSDEENDEGSEENAFEYEEPDGESESEDTQDDGDNSVDEYHASDFNDSTIKDD
ncbi:hypothetical protein F443_19914, partial [Phytophthora nicotianae P1569]